jgi:uncharacterized protein
MEERKSFLGMGWSFPPQFNSSTATVAMTGDEEDIDRSLQILLSTRQGERVMQPTYGCNLDELLFEPLTTSFKTYIKDLVSTAILYFEPRIDVTKIDLDETDELQGKVVISIEYRVRSTNSRFNFVYPFYKAEGTELKK